MDLEIRRLKVGEIKTNCYLLFCNGSLSVIDPGGDFEKIDKEIGKYGKIKPVFILLTHAHYDHLLAVEKLKSKYGFKVVIGEKEIDNLRNISMQGLYTGFSIPHQAKPDIPALDGEVLRFESCDIKVIFTPGHTEGSVCYIIGDNLFSGDTLFYHIYGRTDLISGSQKDMEESLKKIFSIKENLKVLPGHGKESRLNAEREYFTKHQKEMGIQL